MNDILFPGSPVVPVRAGRDGRGASQVLKRDLCFSKFLKPGGAN